MGDTLGKPVLDKHTTVFDTLDMTIAATGMQGWRKKMEDAHTIEFKVGKDRKAAFIAVFDGHNGNRAAKYCSLHLLHHVMRQDAFAAKQYKLAMEQAFIDTDQALEHSEHREEGGCTAVAVLAIDDKLVCANAGDSRAVAYVRGANGVSGAVNLSEDHKPSVPSEVERVEKAGGTIMNGRVNGVLGLTRALGDFEFKTNGVDSAITCRPDVREFPLNPDVEFVVVACDGIWEVLTSEEVCTFLAKELNDHHDPGKACEKLLDEIIAPVGHGLGTDNMTITMWVPKPKFFLS